MGRKRLIDTDRLYFDSELVGLLGIEGLHLYIRLWGLAEDWGGYKANYDDISLQTGALRISAKKVKSYIQTLIKSKHIIPYRAGDEEYHWIRSFMDHQSLNNPSAPRLPLPPWISCEIKEYKSGKKYAKYSLIAEKLPVPYQYPTSTLPVVLETETETETEKKEKRKESRAFRPPSLQEVEAYCKERNNNVDPQQFIDFYQAKGWMVGKNKMKDWKAAVRTWERRERDGPGETKRKPNYFLWPKTGFPDDEEENDGK